MEKQKREVELYESFSVDELEQRMELFCSDYWIYLLFGSCMCSIPYYCE